MKSWKKKLSLILVGIFLITFLFIPAEAENEAVLFCRGTKPDEDGLCTVSVEISGAKGVVMLQFSMNYDAEVVEILDAKPGNAFSGNVAPTVNITEKGSLFFVWDSLTPIPDEGQLLLLDVKVKEYKAVFSFSEENLIAADENCEEYAVSTENLRIADTRENADDSTFASETIPANRGMSLSEQTLCLIEEEKTELSASLEDKTEDTLIVWSSSNEAVAVVDENGVVSSVGAGTAVITANSEDGTAYAACMVTVVLKEAAPDAGAAADQTAQEKNGGFSSQKAADPTAEPGTDEQKTLTAVGQRRKAFLVVSGVYILLMIACVAGNKARKKKAGNKKEPGEGRR